MNSIPNYAHQMNQSLRQKLYCLDYLTECDLIVDFGCADGTMLKALRDAFPDTRLLGFDTSAEMIQIAMMRIGSSTDLTTNWNLIEQEVAKASRPGIIFSSVLHEVYNQEAATPGLVALTWQKMRQFAVICIRDMCVSPKLAGTPVDDRTRGSIHFFFPNRAKTFEQQWGPINNEYQLTHFLLKYRYTDNWAYENAENYLLMNETEFMARASTLTHRLGYHYRFAHKSHHSLPYLVEQINRDTGINMYNKTHIECVLML